MTYDSALHCQIPVFKMHFTKINQGNAIEVLFDCKNLLVKCQCAETFNLMTKLVDHILLLH